MSDKETEEHNTEPTSTNQPSDQGDSNSCKASCCTASKIN